MRTSPEIQRRAQELRKCMTVTEQRLWAALRRGQVAGLRFRRQHPWGSYIFDFFCAELKLVIELDGPIHAEPSQQENDLERDEQCRAHGLTVLRFTNDQVLQELDAILQTILTLHQNPQNN
ncbi:MAG: endonuclease domain-containing protein [Ardenticatenales bacterium]|nr:endonuclease domain-containing protein [Ardenticatenales bacterium]